MFQIINGLEIISNVNYTGQTHVNTHIQYIHTHIHRIYSLSRSITGLGVTTYVCTVN